MKTASLFEDFGLVILGDGDTSLVELDYEQVLSWFRSAKVLLFRGFAPDLKVFEKFTNQFCPEFLGLQGGVTQREAVDPERDKTINHVSTARSYFLKTDPFGIPEKYRVNRSTDAEAAEGNPNENEEESFVTTESIAPTVFESPLSPRPVFVNNVRQFLMIEAGVGCDTDLEFVGKKIPKDDDLIHTIVRLEDGSKIPDDVVSEIDEITNQFTRLVAWEKQDILLVDNTRALHGRRAFSCNREIYIRMGMSIGWEISI